MTDILALILLTISVISTLCYVLLVNQHIRLSNDVIETLAKELLRCQPDMRTKNLKQYVLLTKLLQALKGDSIYL